MPTRLNTQVNSRYFDAANRLTPKSRRRRIVAYVESYDDIYFWRTVLSRFEDDTRYFEVMLPSRRKLERGKKSVLMNIIRGMREEGGRTKEEGRGAGEEGQTTRQPDDQTTKEEGRDTALGPAMIACVDADYDYLLQGATPQSATVTRNPYVLHTYAYAIENLQCYAPSLHDVATGVTLNDHRIFDFCDYMRQYSEAVYPLLVWSVWAYRTGNHSRFPLSDMARVADPGRFSVADPQTSIVHLHRKVAVKVRQLQALFPDGRQAWQYTSQDIARLGVTPQTAYLYIQGHALFDNVVVPILTKVCNRLRQERQDEIQRNARHHTQRRNEMSCYEHSLQDIRQMLKKNTGYTQSEPFLRTLRDAERLLCAEKEKQKKTAV